MTTTVAYVGRISPFGAARADQFFELRPTFTNAWNRKITAIKGTMSLLDPFGTEVYSGNWKVTGLRLPPGASHTQEGFGFTVSGSSGAPGCQGGFADVYGQEGLCSAAADKFRDYTWTFEPESVKFADDTFWP